MIGELPVLDNFIDMNYEQSSKKIELRIITVQW
jgi:hypothetical protein